MGSISLPALHIQPPPDPTEGLKNAIALKGMMQGQQLQNLQLQQGQIALQQQKTALNDQQVIRQAFIAHNGKIDDDMINDAAKGGASPQALTGLQQHKVDLQTKMTQLSDSELKLLNQQHDNLRGVTSPILSAPPEKRAQLYQDARTKVLSNPKFYGINDPNQVPPQYPGDDEMNLLVKGLEGGKEQFQEEIENRKATAAEWKEIPGTGTLVNTNTGQTRSGGVMIPMPPDTAQKAGIPEMAGKPFSPQMLKTIKEASDEGNTYQNFNGQLWLVDKQGKKIEKMGASTPVVTAMIQANPPAPQTRTETTPGGGTVQTIAGMTQEALDQAAERYHTTGQLPPMGRGAAGITQSRAIMNRAAELHPGASLALNSGEYKANMESLKGIQKNFDAVSAFEKTANKNIDLLLTQGKTIIDTGSPFLNTPLRMINAKMVGDENFPAFEAARRVAVNEIAKVASSPNLTGQLSDSARHEVESFIPANATMNQVFRVAQVLKQDMANRHQSLQEQIADIKKRTTQPGGDQTTPTKPIVAPPKSPQDQKTRDQSLGVVYR